MKVYLDVDEKYPDLIIHKEPQYLSYEIEIPDDLINEYETALKKFNDAEGKIFDLWDEAREINKCK